MWAARFFFFNDPATTEIYTLSLHDALPILEMVHPEYRLLHSESEATTEQTLTAVYPTTDGVGQRKWRDMIRQALPRCATEIEELLPKGVDVPGMEISLADALTIQIGRASCRERV